VLDSGARRKTAGLSALRERPLKRPGVAQRKDDENRPVTANARSPIEPTRAGIWAAQRDWAVGIDPTLRCTVRCVQAGEVSYRVMSSSRPLVM
jgi:hypothetical protein